MDASDGGLRCFSRAGHAGRQRSRPHLKLDWLLVLPASDWQRWTTPSTGSYSRPALS